MTEQHLALVVEDDLAIAEDLVQIVEAMGCETRTTSNSREALLLLDEVSFCFILLDLQIKSDAHSLKGNVAYGNALLREIRNRHSVHTGQRWWLPVIIVSGYANEVAAAIDVMRLGASEIIHKPFITGVATETIRRALYESGRSDHSACESPPGHRLTPLRRKGDHQHSWRANGSAYQGDCRRGCCRPSEPGPEVVAAAYCGASGR